MSLQKFIFLLLVFWLINIAKSTAQFSESFDDGDFTNNPAWAASDDALWQINAGELQSNSSTAATYFISTISEVAAEATWRFKVNLKFSTSGANYVDVYLMADSENLSMATNGYFVRVGDTQDEIVLYKLSAGSEVSLIDNAEGVVNSSSNNLFVIEVTRNASNNWTLKYDDEDTGSFTTAGSIVDGEISQSQFFGILVEQSGAAGPIANHFFDGIMVSGLAGQDTQPPILDDLNVNSQSELILYFSETLDISTAENSNNYFVNNEVENPNTATLSGADNSAVILTFNNSFENGVLNEITIDNIEDLNGNTISTTSDSFRYYQEEPILFKDVIINEMLADPSPPNDLPEAEFVELYNRSTKAFNLDGWRFGDAVSSVALPEYFLLPGEFILLTSSFSVADFQSFGSVIGVSGFPSLNNSADELKLFDNSDLIIDSVFYSIDWYRDEQKDDGGWSLELINPENTCGEEENWIASEASIGGTPGKENSVFDLYFDDEPPFIIEARVIDDQTIPIRFNQILDPSSLALSQIAINPVLNIADTQVDEEILTISLSQMIVDNTVYEIAIEGLSDCSGNAINEPETVEIINVGEVPIDPKDIIITELMADPSPPNDLPEAEYIEIYNRSEKIINLENWTMGDLSTTTASLPNVIIFPSEYVVVSHEEETSQFNLINIIGTKDFPSLNNGSDFIYLKTSEGIRVDSVNYDDSWYQSSTKQEGGWSLELVDPENLCGEEDNWTASINPSGGTPGKQNSVFATNPDLRGPELLEAFAISSDSVMLLFDERLDLESVIAADYNIEPSLGSLEIRSIDEKSILVKPELSVAPKTLYTIEVERIKDCTGNLINTANASGQFALVEEADSLDLIINEILFNPRSGGVDFVEIYNNSTKFINLRDWQLANGEILDSLLVETTKTITEENLLIGPSSYKVLTEDVVILKEQYPLAREDEFIEISMPSFPNKEGVCVLISPSNISDYFAYSEDMHSDLLDIVDGIALERVSFNEKTNNPDNWKSAVASEGFATPGYVNSNSRREGQLPAGEIKIEPKVIIPDGSGQNDFATINYSFENTGKVANVTIHDVNGRSIKTIANNYFLGTDGFFTWDGLDENGGKVRVGYYIVLFELFDQAGNTQIIKEKVVVGSRF